MANMWGPETGTKAMVVTEVYCTAVMSTSEGMAAGASERQARVNTVSSSVSKLSTNESAMMAVASVYYAHFVANYVTTVRPCIVTQQSVVSAKPTATEVQWSTMMA